MKKLKRKVLYFFTAIILTSSLTSCMTTKTSVGEYKETQGYEYAYAKGKFGDYYLLGVPVQTHLKWCL